MKRVCNAGIACCVVAVFGSALSYGAAPIFRSLPDPSTFHSSQELYLNGRPAAYDRFISLTPSLELESGRCWIRRPQNILYGFGTIFEVRLSADSLPDAASDFAFLVHSAADRALEIRFVAGGEIRVSAGHELALVSSTRLAPDFADGALHTVKIEYTPSQLLVYADDLVVPVLAVRIDLNRALDLDSGYAWIGFQSAALDLPEDGAELNWAFVAAGD